jgi:hypothetical protein
LEERLDEFKLFADGIICAGNFIDKFEEVFLG